MYVVGDRRKDLGNCRSFVFATGNPEAQTRLIGSILTGYNGKLLH